MPKQSDQRRRKGADSKEQPEQKVPKRKDVTAAQLRMLGSDDLASVRKVREPSSGIADLPDSSATSALTNLQSQTILLDSATMRAVMDLKSRVALFDSATMGAVLDIQRHMDSLFANVNIADTLAAYLSNAIPRFEMAGLAAKMLDQIKLTDSSYRNMLAGLAESARSMAAFSDLAIASATLSASLADMMEAVSAYQLPQTHPLLSAAIFAPHEALTDFIWTTRERLERAERQEQRSALGGSLVLAEDQLMQSTAALEAILKVPSDEDTGGPTYPVNALAVQQQELLASSTVAPDASLADLMSAAPTSGITEQSRHVESLIVRCNESSELRGGEEIFKPTTKMLWAYSGLPWIAATDDSSLGNFVDCLYLMLYEGGGGDSLRFMGRNLLTGEDCAAVWHLKHLRNYHLRHDPDHGNESDRKRKWRDLQLTLQALGLSDWPQSPVDYLLLQQRILLEVVAFLTRLVRVVSSQDD